MNHPIKKRKFSVHLEHAAIHRVLYATVDPEDIEQGSGKTALATGLDDRVESNAGWRGNVDEAASSNRLVVLAASNVLLALLVEEVVDTDQGGDGDLLAAREDTNTLGAADGVAEKAVQEAVVEGGGVANLGDMVAARQSGVFTALVLGLLQRVLVGAGEGRVDDPCVGEGQSGGSEERDNSEELHFENGLEEFA